MKVIGHDAPGGDAHRDALQGLAEQAGEGVEVFIVVEHRRLGVASGDDVIGHVGDGGARGARHGRSLTHRLGAEKLNVPFFFRGRREAIFVERAAHLTLRLGAGIWSGRRHPP